MTDDTHTFRNRYLLFQGLLSAMMRYAHCDAWANAWDENDGECPFGTGSDMPMGCQIESVTPEFSECPGYARDECFEVCMGIISSAMHGTVNLWYDVEDLMDQGHTIQDIAYDLYMGAVGHGVGGDLIDVEGYFETPCYL